MLLVASALAADVQVVVLHASFVSTVPEAVAATVQQSGSAHTVTLVDDGSDRNDARGDRVWTGTVEGDPAQYLPITVAATVDGEKRDVWRGVVRVGLEPTVDIAVEVTTDPAGNLVGARRASASPGRVAHATEAIPLLTAAFWVVFLFAFAAAALRLRAEPQG
jgi:hypothetical protein